MLGAGLGKFSGANRSETMMSSDPTAETSELNGLLHFSS